MKKKNAGSVAPKERVNISYKPAVGDGKKQIELPFKALILGDFTQRPDDRVIEEREPINVNSNNFDEVLASMGLEMQFSVPNYISGNGETDIDVNFKPQSLKDFTPDNLVDSIPELKKVIELRNALKALKGPLGNVPQMRRKIQTMITDESTRKRLLDELNSDGQQG
ncbi:type VI secretion system contractile sheath small subunit [Oceanobacter mangrovi]|uniref:type VI secretion system contractile sheath small subunit n=1 Tax=Oceanobacter mangrovi TaxID=2862510 RepID=UPI001C8EF99D|nr:type VI secretion system contractile sheath small subunit [Oceanobacter mangrovi]